MKQNIEITVNNKTGEASLSTESLGVNSENLQGKLIFKFTDEFVDGIGLLETQVEEDTDYIILEKNGDTYETDIKSSLLKSKEIALELRITERENPKGIPIFKSKIFYMYVSDAINATEEKSEEYDAWIDISNQKLLEFEKAINEVETLDIDIDDDSNITITNKDGSTTTKNIRGERGPKGEPGAIKIEILNELPETGSDDTLYFIPKENPTENDKYDTYTWTNDDWEYIGGANIAVDLTDCVKNTDYPSQNVAGVVKVFPGDHGVRVVNGVLQILKATDDEITNKKGEYRPIVGSTIEKAVKVGITTNTIELTDEESQSARDWINAVGYEDYPISEANTGNLTAGVVKVGNFQTGYGIGRDLTGSKIGLLKTTKAQESDILNRTHNLYIDTGTAGPNNCNPIVPANLDFAVKETFINNKLVGTNKEWTDDEKTSVKELLSINDIKTIVHDETAGYDCRILEMEEGIYFLSKGVVIKYGNDDDKKFTVENCSYYLFVSKTNNDYNRTHFTIIGAGNSSWYIYGTDSDLSYESKLNTIILASLLSNQVAQSISKVWTFSAQPLITAEQNDYTESSTNIPTMAWVQGAIQQALSDKGL